MNLYTTMIILPVAAAMVWVSVCGLIRAERVGRCPRPFVLPVFAGIAALVLFGLQAHDLLQIGKTPRDVYFAMQLIICVLFIAVILLVIPHLRRRGH